MKRIALAVVVLALAPACSRAFADTYPQGVTATKVKSYPTGRIYSPACFSDPSGGTCIGEVYPDGGSTFLAQALGQISPLWRDAGGGSIASATAASCTIDLTGALACPDLTADALDAGAARIDSLTVTSSETTPAVEAPSGSSITIAGEQAAGATASGITLQNVTPRTNGKLLNWFNGASEAGYFAFDGGLCSPNGCMAIPASSGSSGPTTTKYTHDFSSLGSQAGSTCGTYTFGQAGVVHDSACVPTIAGNFTQSSSFAYLCYVTDGAINFRVCNVTTTLANIDAVTWDFYVTH